MELVQLIGDPLYQMNLTLWMLQPQPNGSITVEPILRNAGFSLREIERPLPLPPALLTKLVEDGIAVQAEAAPDLLLNGPNKLVVLWECKRSTFGAPQGDGESHHRQARNYLLHSPQVLAGALAAATGSVQRSHVIYLSRLNVAHDQTEGLQSLRDTLTMRQNATAPFCLLALSANGGCIEIRQTGSASTALPGLESLAPPKTVQSSTDDQTDPRPLYYIPWMPESEPRTDTYNFHSFGCRVLNATAEVIGLTRPPNEATIDFEEALQRATSGHYRLWRNKTTRQAIREGARKLIREVVSGASADVKIQPVGHPATTGWRIEVSHDRIKGKIIKALRQWPGHDWITPHMVQAELPLETNPTTN